MTRWERVPIELALLHILKDASVDGRVQNAAPQAGIWPALTTQLNAATGMSKTTAQVQEKLRRMKKQWRRFDQLLNHETSFGWNPDTNSVSGTVAQWDAYLAVSVFVNCHLIIGSTLNLFEAY